LLYSTLFSGSSQDSANGIDADAAGNAYVVGTARSSDLPTTSNAYQSTFGGIFDDWLAILAPDPAASAPSVTALPSIINFSMPIGGTAPAPQTVTVNASSGATISASVSTASTWLSVNQTGASQLSISVNPAGLAIGQYNGTIQVAAGGGTPMNLSVTFRIVPLVAVLKSLSPAVVPLSDGGPTPPVPVTITISGSNFVSGATVQFWIDGINYFTLSSGTVVVDANTIQIPFPANCYANSTTLGFTVTNPGTAPSNGLGIECGPPEPRIFNVSNSAAPLAFAVDSSQPISPGELITINGSDFGSPFGTVPPANSSTPATKVGLTRVLFDGVPVPITYVATRQINAAAPYSLGNKPTTSIVVEYDGVASAPLTVQLVPSEAALFTADSSGKGQGSILNQDATPNASYNPAAAGSIVTLYATGMGLTDSSAKPVLPVTVTIDGQPVQLVTAYATPGVVGLVTATVRIPSGVHSGPAVPITLQVGSSQSQPGVTIAIQ
jgi:uncharacterized protein (TIGR03437 family)